MTQATISADALSSQVNGESLRIVLTTLGSLGDLHPYLGVALELKALGHQPVIASCPIYRAKVETLGIPFFPVRPEIEAPEVNREQITYFMHETKGPQRVIREWAIPNLRDAYADIDIASEGADLLVSHPLTFVTPVVAEHRGIPWASSVLAPVSFMSAHDPSLVPFPAIRFWHKLGPRFMATLMNLGKRVVSRWFEPLQQLRDELGLPRVNNPLFEGQHSPELVLAMYSDCLGTPQVDWPNNVVVTGFSFYDKHKNHELSDELNSFLEAGSPPVVFTLGSSAVIDPGLFYLESVKAIEKLGRRAVLLTGSGLHDNIPKNLPRDVIAAEYAPFSELFPRAAAIVHQGGAGTTGQALHAGRPTVIVPWAHDQPDNANRIRKLGVSRTIERKDYQADHVAAELKILLEEPSYAEKALEVGKKIESENGSRRAAEELLKLGMKHSQSHGHDKDC